MVEINNFDLKTVEGVEAFKKAVEEFNRRSAEWSRKREGLRDFLNAELKRLGTEGRQGDIVIAARTLDGNYVSEAYKPGDHAFHRTNYKWCELYGFDMVETRSVGN